MRSIGVPKIIFDKDDKPWEFVSAEKGFKSFIYKHENTHLSLYPWAIEKDFSKKGRPAPTEPIVLQGKYECAAAALAMLLDEPLFYVKRAMGKLGWRNDNTGAHDQLIIDAARLLGRDLISLESYEIKENIGPALITVNSLNVSGMGHAVTWTGKEILDPNWGFKGRAFWGTEWHPSKMMASGALVLLNFSLTAAERERLDAKIIKKQKEEIMRKKNENIKHLKQIKK